MINQGFCGILVSMGDRTPLNLNNKTMKNKQPTRNQITRFEVKHQDCAGPYSDGSYVSVLTGRKYTAAYIARTYSDKPFSYNAVFLGS